MNPKREFDPMEENLINEGKDTQESFKVVEPSYSFTSKSLSILRINGKGLKIWLGMSGAVVLLALVVYNFIQIRHLHSRVATFGRLSTEVDRLKAELQRVELSTKAELQRVDLSTKQQAAIADESIARPISEPIRSPERRLTSKETSKKVVRNRKPASKKETKASKKPRRQGKYPAEKD